MFVSCEQGNGALVKYLIAEGGGVSDVVNKDKHNMLHLMASQCMDYQMAPLLNAMAVSPGPVSC